MRTILLAIPALFMAACAQPVAPQAGDVPLVSISATDIASYYNEHIAELQQSLEASEKASLDSAVGAIRPGVSYLPVVIDGINISGMTTFTEEDLASLRDAARTYRTIGDLLRAGGVDTAANLKPLSASEFIEDLRIAVGSQAELALITCDSYNFAEQGFLAGAVGAQGVATASGAIGAVPVAAAAEAAATVSGSLWAAMFFAKFAVKAINRVAGTNLSVCTRPQSSSGSSVASQPAQPSPSPSTQPAPASPSPSSSGGFQSLGSTGLAPSQQITGHLQLPGTANKNSGSNTIQ